MFYLLLVDVWEVLDVRVVELFDGFGKLSVDINQLFKRFFEVSVLFVEKAFLLFEVL